MPVGQNLSVNLEIITGDGTQQLVERIPDTSPLKPATWIPLKLIEPDPTGIGAIESLTPALPKGEGAIYDLSGLKVNSQSTIHHAQLTKGIYIEQGGKKILR